MSNGEKTGLEKWAYFVLILWAGFQILSEIAQFVPTWISIAYVIATIISGVSPPPHFVYLAVLISPALIIPIVGWLALEISRIGRRVKKLPSEPIARRAEPSSKVQIRVVNESAANKLLDAITNEIARKPWWVITIFATLLSLGIVSLPISVQVAFTIGILLLFMIPFSIIRLIVSLLRLDEASLEKNFLLAFFSFTLFIGFVTFQTNNINEVLGRWHVLVTQLQIHPPRLLPTPIRNFLSAKNPVDYVRMSIIICAIISGLVNMLTSQPRIRGFVSGALFGGIIGLGVGATASFAWVFGMLISQLFQRSG